MTASDSCGCICHKWGDEQEAFFTQRYSVAHLAFSFNINKSLNPFKTTILPSSLGKIVLFPKMPNQPTGDPKQHDPSTFSESLSGSCLCGSITVTIHDKELFTRLRGHLCHCSNCRKVAGSYVASNLLIEAEKVTIDDKNGTLKCYEDKATLSGNPVYRFFCSTDGK